MTSTSEQLKGLERQIGQLRASLAVQEFWAGTGTAIVAGGALEGVWQYIPQVAEKASEMSKLLVQSHDFFNMFTFQWGEAALVVGGGLLVGKVVGEVVKRSSDKYKELMALNAMRKQARIQNMSTDTGKAHEQGMAAIRAGVGKERHPADPDY